MQYAGSFLFGGLLVLIAWVDWRVRPQDKPWAIFTGCVGSALAAGTLVVWLAR